MAGGPVRNFCVARGHITTSGLTFLYTVPAATSFILKSLIVSTGAATAETVPCYVIPRDGSFALALFTETVTATQTFTWSTELVLNDGDKIALNAPGTDTEYWLSGALLPYSVGQTAPA